jgi:hypothetical protein
MTLAKIPRDILDAAQPIVAFNKQRGVSCFVKLPECVGE